MKHGTTIPTYGTDFKRLADDVGNLRYDALQEFLAHLAEKLEEDSIADARRERKKLSKSLKEATGHIDLAMRSVGKAWKISKPHMNVEKTNSSLFESKMHAWEFQNADLTGRYSHYKCKHCKETRTVGAGGNLGQDNCPTKS